MSCNGHVVGGVGRRQFIRSAVAGSMLFPGLLSQLLAGEEKTSNEDPLAPKATHFPPKAKRVIFLFMTGGVSHVESFDPKPKLFADHNKAYEVNEFQGKQGKFNLYLKKPQWEFKPYGQSGTQVSGLFPNIGSVVDDLCVIRSMRSDHTNHYEATLGIHTGSFTMSRPCIGSWLSYGLGTTNQNLPSFMVIAPKMPYAGSQVWASDFLPGCHQGTLVVPGPEPIANIKRRVATEKLQDIERHAMEALNQQHFSERNTDPTLAARIKSFETAFGMQQEAPEALILRKRQMRH